jgi:hypothetical protein
MSIDVPPKKALRCPKETSIIVDLEDKDLGRQVVKEVLGQKFVLILPDVLL